MRLAGARGRLGLLVVVGGDLAYGRRVGNGGDMTVDDATVGAARSGPGYGEGRQALLEAAVHVVATRGLRHLTYRSVAQQAGVAHGLVAHHFGTRDALLEAALEFSLDNSVGSISADPGSGDLDALFAGVVEMVQSNPDDQAFQYELILEARRRPELRPQVEQVYATYGRRCGRSWRPRECARTTPWCTWSSPLWTAWYSSRSVWTTRRCTSWIDRLRDLLRPLSRNSVSAV